MHTQTHSHTQIRYQWNTCILGMRLLYWLRPMFSCVEEVLFLKRSLDIRSVCVRMYGCACVRVYVCTGVLSRDMCICVCERARERCITYACTREMCAPDAYVYAENVVNPKRIEQTLTTHTHHTHTHTKSFAFLWFRGTKWWWFGTLIQSRAIRKCMWVYVNECRHVRVCVCACVHICVCMVMCICIFVCISVRLLILRVDIERVSHTKHTREWLFAEHTYTYTHIHTITLSLWNDNYTHYILSLNVQFRYWWTAWSWVCVCMCVCVHVCVCVYICVCAGTFPLFLFT